MGLQAVPWILHNTRPQAGISRVTKVSLNVLSELLWHEPEFPYFIQPISVLVA